MTDISVFKKFLDARDPNEKYDFLDFCGNCLIGRFMAAQGEEWSMNNYADHARTPVGKTHLGIIASGDAFCTLVGAERAGDRGEWTVGKAKERLEKALEEV